MPQTHSLFFGPIELPATELVRVRYATGRGEYTSRPMPAAEVAEFIDQVKVYVERFRGPSANAE